MYLTIKESLLGEFGRTHFFWRSLWISLSLTHTGRALVKEPAGPLKAFPRDTICFNVHLLLVSGKLAVRESHILNLCLATIHNENQLFKSPATFSSSRHNSLTFYLLTCVSISGMTSAFESTVVKKLKNYILYKVIKKFGANSF